MQQQECILPDLPMYGEGEIFPDWIKKRVDTTTTIKPRKKAKKINPFERAKIQKKTPFSRSHKKKKPEDLVRNKKAAAAKAAVKPSQEYSMGISFAEMAADWYAKEEGIVLVYGDRFMCGGGSIRLSQHSFYSSNRFGLALPASAKPF